MKLILEECVQSYYKCKAKVIIAENQDTYTVILEKLVSITDNSLAL